MEKLKPPMGLFFIQSSDEGTLFASEFGDGSPILTEGYAGWNVVERPKDIGTVEWAGRLPMAIEIPFFLNYYYDPWQTDPGERCEAMISNLETLCGIGGHSQPPICRVNGNSVIPHDEATSGVGTHWWVIEQVNWEREQEVRSRASGNRMQAGGTILIRQYIDDKDILHKFAMDAAGKKKKRKTKSSHYTVKKGDTLSKIAARFYRDASKWKVIADANHIRDHRKIYVGQKLRIPAL